MSLETNCNLRFVKIKLMQISEKIHRRKFTRVIFPNKLRQTYRRGPSRWNFPTVTLSLGYSLSRGPCAYKLIVCLWSGPQGANLPYPAPRPWTSDWSRWQSTRRTPTDRRERCTQEEFSSRRSPVCNDGRHTSVKNIARQLPKNFIPSIFFESFKHIETNWLLLKLAVNWDWTVKTLKMKQRESSWTLKRGKTCVNTRTWLYNAFIRLAISLGTLNILFLFDGQSSPLSLCHST